MKKKEQLAQQAKLSKSSTKASSGKTPSSKLRNVTYEKNFKGEVTGYSGFDADGNYVHFNVGDGGTDNGKPTPATTTTTTQRKILGVIPSKRN